MGRCMPQHRQNAQAQSDVSSPCDTSESSYPPPRFPPLGTQGCPVTLSGLATPKLHVMPLFTVRYWDSWGTFPWESSSLKGKYRENQLAPGSVVPSVRGTALHWKEQNQPSEGNPHLNRWSVVLTQFKFLYLSHCSLPVLDCQCKIPLFLVGGAEAVGRGPLSRVGDSDMITDVILCSELDLLEGPVSPPHVPWF